MENKKNNEADLESIRSSLFMVGLNYIAGIVLAAFTFQTISGDNGMAELNEKSAENVYQQDEKKEETPPPVETPQVDVPPPVTEDIIEEENTEEEPITVVEVLPVVIAEETVIVEEEIIEFPDVEAEFKGGAQAMMKYIQQNIQYPPTSIEMNEQGKVYLSFVVEADGSISNVSIERGVSKDIDNEAKRIVRSMPKWTPGEAKGKKSRTRCRLPINFQLG
jgi:periplasmic protein TonB